MALEVEVFSYIDPVYVRDRNVWYYAQFQGIRSEHLTEHAPIAELAEAVRAEHDGVLIDRSDKDSGYLRRVLAAELGQ
jgi:hypothetical protein